MFRPRDQEDERFISTGEAQAILEVSEPELEKLVTQGKLPAYKLGEQVLRYRKDQVSELKASWRIGTEVSPEEVHYHSPRVDEIQSAEDNAPEGFGARCKDFWYFYDFYIIGFIVIAALVYFTFS